MRGIALFALAIGFCGSSAFAQENCRALPRGAATSEDRTIQADFALLREAYGDRMARSQSVMDSRCGEHFTGLCIMPMVCRHTSDRTRVRTRMITCLATSYDAESRTMHCPSEQDCMRDNDRRTGGAEPARAGNVAAADIPGAGHIALERRLLREFLPRQVRDFIPPVVISGTGCRIDGHDMNLCGLSGVLTPEGGGADMTINALAFTEGSSCPDMVGFANSPTTNPAHTEIGGESRRSTTVVGPSDGSGGSTASDDAPGVSYGEGAR